MTKLISDMTPFDYTQFRNAERINSSDFQLWYTKRIPKGRQLTFVVPNKDSGWFEHFANINIMNESDGIVIDDARYITGATTTWEDLWRSLINYCENEMERRAVSQ